MGKDTDDSKDVRLSLEKEAEVESFTSDEPTISRRTFFKIAGSAAVALTASPIIESRSGFVKPAYAAQPGSYDSCRTIVFGSDSLRIDYAHTLKSSGAPALSRLNDPITATCGGATNTQAGWASIWTALPSYEIGVYDNGKDDRNGRDDFVGDLNYRSVPNGTHIMHKIAHHYISQGKDPFIAWVTSKSGNLKSKGKNGPHKKVRKLIEGGEVSGYYDGKDGLSNQQAYDSGYSALTEALQCQDFAAFIHFGDPDDTGHETTKYSSYMDQAREVDNYISDLMDLLPASSIPGSPSYDTNASDFVNVIYCSDHGFDFQDQGDLHNGHGHSPHGMLATNFPTLSTPYIDQMSIGRLIYKLAGGNPNCTFKNKNFGRSYRMSGMDLL
jgi:hypothetical protein